MRQEIRDKGQGTRDMSQETRDMELEKGDKGAKDVSIYLKKLTLLLRCILCGSFIII